MGLLSGTTDFSTSSSENVFTYSADARWHSTPETMLYLRIATGYAPGGPNDVLPGSTLPQQYQSSKTTNYEVGIKGRLLEDKASAEISVFHIDWKDIQIETLIGSLFAVTNGGKAKSDGVEWNFSYVPMAGLTLNFNGAYVHARLAEPLPPPTAAPSGSVLPDVPPWSTALGVRYLHPLFGDYSGVVEGNCRYADARYAEFLFSGPRQHMPSYNMVDLRTGLESEHWSLSVYAKNLGNTIAFSSVSPLTAAGGAGPQYATVLTPRTVGIDLAANF